MPIDPQQTPGFPLPDSPVPGPEPALQAPVQVKPAPVAPLWHTLLIAALVLGNSFLGSSKLDSAGGGHGSRLLLYGGTFVTQVVLILIIWFGIHLRGVRMRDLIGGHWENVEAFLLDVALAIGFWIVSLALLFVLRVALGTIDIHHLAKSQEDAIKLLGPLAPHSYLEAGFWVALSVSAGLFEEIIFRGYFQRQFLGLTNSAALGIIVSGIIFGLAHGYQGGRMMVTIAVFGMFFGVMAHVRKSLRPGMMTHAFQDAIAGLTLFALVRHH
jgi:membrane protease YdiL (CAAX protease family)